VDAITTSEISVAMTVDEGLWKKEALVKDLEKLGEVSWENDLSLVSLIGNRINHTPGLALSIFSALNRDQSLEPINVRMICYGASKHNFCFLVSHQQASEAISRLHGHFIEGGHQ
jgi:aspartate kinase